MQNTDCEVNATDSTMEKSVRTQRVHGGNIIDAIARYGIDEKDIIDFSSNVNPLGPSSAAKRAIKRSLSSIDQYPEPHSIGLRKAIARYFGIKPEQVICGNGSNSLIHLIPRAFRPKKVLIPVPTFAEYAAAIEDVGGEVVPLSLDEAEGFRVDPLEMAFALKGMDMAFLCNPNNPTGRLIPKAEMLEIATYALKEGVRLVVDEAFMDFDEAPAIIKEAVEFSHLICLRAFTKFYGMPGLRVGYGVSNDETIARLIEAQEPWSVSIPAEQAAAAAMNDWKYCKKTRRVILKERERLLEELRILPGIHPFPSVANFLFIRLASIDAQTLTRKLGLRNILVRDCSSFPGLGNRYIRIAVRTRRENKQLLKALRDILIA